MYLLLSDDVLGAVGFTGRFLMHENSNTIDILNTIRKVHGAVTVTLLPSLYFSPAPSGASVQSKALACAPGREDLLKLFPMAVLLSALDCETAFTQLNSIRTAVHGPAFCLSLRRS